MLSKKQQTKLCEIFKTLPVFDRQLLALKSICFQYATQYGFEKRVIEAVVDSGVTNEKNVPLTTSLYQNCNKKLMSQGFSSSKTLLAVHEELHHAFLTLMSAEELTWVFSMVDQLVAHEIPHFTEEFNYRSYSYADITQIKARVMKAIYANEPEYFIAHSNNPTYCSKLMEYVRSLFAEVPVQVEWIQSKHPVMQSFICVALLGDYYCEKKATINTKEILAAFEKQSTESLNHDILHYYSSSIYLSLGDIKKAAWHCAHIQDLQSGFSLVLQATIALLTSQNELVSIQYRKALTALRRQHEHRGYYFDTFLGIFHQLSLTYLDKNPLQLNVHVEQYRKYAQNNAVLPMQKSYSLLPLLLLIEQGEQKAAQSALRDHIKNPDDKTIHPMAMVIYYLLNFMINKAYVNEHSETLHEYVMQCIQQKQMLAVHLLYELLARVPQYQEESHAFLGQDTIKLRFLELINVKDDWEYSFQALEGLLLKEGSVTSILPTKTKRLLWLIDTDKLTVEVLEQSLNKSGWSLGKAVNLSKLKQYHLHEQFNYVSNDDKLAINCLVIKDEGWHSYYGFDRYRTLLALVGHKHLAHAKNRSVPIELVRGEPELHIEENKQGYQLSLSHWLTSTGVIIEPESLNKYRVVDFSPAFVEIGQILTKQGLAIPAHAKEKVLRVIQHAKRDIHIHVGIKDIIPETMGDPTPYIQLLPTKEGVRATLWVRPLINQGSYYKAGQGKESIMTLVTDSGVDTRTRIVRDLKCEKKNQTQLLAKCPALSSYEVEPGEYEIDTPEETLEMLSQLQQFATTLDQERSIPSLVIEWPQGQTFKIKQRVFSSGFSLNISSVNNWFEFGGKIALDDGEVLGMQDLLDAVKQQSYGRFIRLNNGEFIELSSQLKQQLSVLAAISDGNKINSLGAQVLSDIVAEAENTTFDAGWQAHLQKLKTMKTYTPKVPSTLQTTLRDYQIEGFQYLSRLTQWGIGACLADDMGLGKTVQTIALLLESAKQGPALVIAPTSVTFNWIEELNKFAPTLNVYDLRVDDRAALIEKATQFDVIICSYGLLQYNEMLLSSKEWETIVLDEAQAIKNANTQRWKAVMTLKGHARIALSGTPIENHLGELWSIFSFINPGLLGNIKSFQNKYSTPIETKQSSDKVHALKALVSPYILRRMKSDVLKELPPKIEQTIHVEQSEEEAVFYEALRRSAEERMTHFMQEKNRIGVLAEITKLRQACCDSSLVDASLVIENSKLNVFIETLKNIIDNGHKALVFSQYVSFLAIVKQRVEAEKISYQYLDGSTSAVNRKKSVDAFQSGEGGVFLLSLKAGGSGLNLTAADYVIHLDPWWNPAVEDQASDRAHRMGQERPVTIYRFVMQNTIEEKIISLHEHKRHLASELLSGQGISGKLSNEDLMNLIHQSGDVPQHKVKKNRVKELA